MALRTSVGMVGIATETTPGTFVAPTTTILSAFDVGLKVDSKAYERKELKATWGQLDFIPGIATTELTFKMLMQGSGTAGTAPDWNLFLQGCGWGYKDNGIVDSSWVPLTKLDGSAVNSFTPGKNGGMSLTFWEDGVKYEMSGCSGNVKFVCKVGEPMVMEFTYRGQYRAVAPEAVPASTAAATGICPNFVNASVDVNFGSSYSTMELESFELDTGNTLSDNMDANSTSGLKGVLITARKLAAKIDPLHTLPATHDWYAIMRAATVGTMSVGPVGSAGSIFEWTFGRVHYKTVSPGERNGFRINDVEVEPSITSAFTDGSTTECLLKMT